LKIFIVQLGFKTGHGKINGSGEFTRRGAGDAVVTVWDC